MTLFWFLVALGVLVTFHEFGHFYIARRCGVKVERFSIGFGKPLIRWYDKLGTEYAIAAIPLGGYVKMLDERQGPVEAAELSNAFTQKSVWARIAIVAAGPIANLILAIILFWAVFLTPQTYLAPIIGDVTPSSVAESARLESGQEIISIDGEPTPTWEAVNHALVRRLGESGEIVFETKYSDSDLEYQSSTYLNEWLKGASDPDPIAGVGIEIFRPQVEPVVGSVQENSPAFKAGIEIDDRFVALDGEPISDWNAFVEYVSTRPNELIRFTVERDGQLIDLDIEPEAVNDQGKTIGRIGFSPYAPSWPEGTVRKRSFSVGEAFVEGVVKTWETSGVVLLSLKKLIVGEISTKSLSGPLTIAKVAGDSAEAGFVYFLKMLGLLSVSLAIFNLLPIPVLDGGHLTYYIIEAIKGKPLSERVQAIGYRLGLFVVAGVMILAFYNDLVRLFQGQLFNLPV
ncbi:RIP metalloprotease RseP [Sessilibacter corallicola]|uniref:RIP metalloprotease RseP n=1 Tax=Sessilibacter corallicola TaxID=2904075 RepID=UPI001E4E2B09|nr:RIP metalloprotease RseP [Sessilibacter corallicola]MCE2028391.1 RIP metalloprotease RseP [Sessilibacter corallicola]